MPPKSKAKTKKRAVATSRYPGGKYMDRIKTDWTELSDAKRKAVALVAEALHNGDTTAAKVAKCAKKSGTKRKPSGYNLYIKEAVKPAKGGKGLSFKEAVDRWTDEEDRVKDIWRKKANPKYKAKK